MSLKATSQAGRSCFKLKPIAPVPVPISKTRKEVLGSVSKIHSTNYDENRKSAVGTGDRSERIRTYNYPQNRVTDHRIGLSLNKLDRIMNGESWIFSMIFDKRKSPLLSFKNGHFIHFVHNNKTVKKR